MSKKIKNFIMVIVILVIFVLFFPIYAGTGMMGKTLQYPFLMVKPLCVLVGGEFDQNTYGITGQKRKNTGTCMVKSDLICKLRGGEIFKVLTKDENTNEMVFSGLLGACYRK